MEDFARAGEGHGVILCHDGVHSCTTTSS
jgi:hypothetical protein